MALRRNSLPLVREHQAQGQIREVFADVRQTFGTPQVDEVFCAYAATPLFLEAVWGSLRHAIASTEVVALTERLRALAYTATFNYFPVPDLCSRLGEMRYCDGERHELVQLIEWLQLHDARLLLLTSAIIQAMERPTVAKPGDGQSRVAPDGETALQRPPASLVLIDEQQVSPALARTVSDIRRAHGLPFLAADYRVLARWPGYLEQCWQALAPMLAAPLYHECQQKLRMEAASMARDLPATMDLTVGSLLARGLTQEEIASAGHISEVFAQVYSSLGLNMALARISLEGGNSIPAQQRPAASEQTPRRVA